MALITAAQAITYSMNNANFSADLINDNLIEVTELNHVKAALGSDFYYDVINDTATYATLLNGGTYTDSEGYTKSFQGLKKALGFFVKYEALPELMLQITNLGLQVNNSEFSNSASSAQRAEIRETALRQANALMDECLEYLDEKVSTYTRYKKGTYKTIGGIILER